MTRLPLVDYRTMEKVLLFLGFQAVRQKGSHVFYRHPDGRTTTVPHHPGRSLARLIPQEAAFMYDVVHLNPAGSQLAARIISEKLLPRLGNARGQLKEREIEME